jgi:hypothetical protein
MTPHINPIATRFKGVKFRSRREARWASVFSALRWRWEYEPLDLNGYIPDFILLFEAGPVLVEVKPAWSLGDMRAAQDKIDTSGWETKNPNRALVVGATWNLDDNQSVPVIGALCQLVPGWDFDDSSNNIPSRGGFGIGYGSYRLNGEVVRLSLRGLCQPTRLKLEL